jgi:hypothetical protein
MLMVAFGIKGVGVGAGRDVFVGAAVGVSVGITAVGISASGGSVGAGPQPIRPAINIMNSIRMKAALTMKAIRVIFVDTAVSPLIIHIYKSRY